MQDGMSPFSLLPAEGYLVTQGATPLDAISLKAQVYMAVFELPGRPPKIAKLVAAENGTRQVSVSF
jgi:hypothetical protein